MKVKIEELQCYPQVASVLGETQAKLELFKVVNKLDFSDPDIWFVDEKNLCDTFNWVFTPQGYNFWEDVYNASK